MFIICIENEILDLAFFISKVGEYYSQNVQGGKPAPLPLTGKQPPWLSGWFYVYTLPPDPPSFLTFDLTHNYTPAHGNNGRGPALLHLIMLGFPGGYIVSTRTVPP